MKKVAIDMFATFTLSSDSLIKKLGSFISLDIFGYSINAMRSAFILSGLPDNIKYGICKLR